MEEIITNHVELNVKSLINQYKQRVVGLSSKLDLEGINIDPFKILDGDMVVISDMNSILEELTQTDKVEMDKEWISNSRKNGLNHGHGSKNQVGIRMSMVTKNILREQNSQKGFLHLLNNISMTQRIWLLIMQKCKHRQSKGNLRRNSIFWMIFYKNDLWN